jgi:glycosyltransferase involved in cell wall biosynthesis
MTKMKNPQISIIVYCLNYIYLTKTINSIQNQQNIDFEIIVVYDNTINFDLIKENLQIYKNIKIFQNEEAKGILSSFLFGVLESEGEFFLFLKSGETLATEKVLFNLYNKIKNSSYDILEFNLLVNNNDLIKANSLRMYRCQHIKSLINYDSFKYNRNYKELDQEEDLITNKLIIASLFKKIIIKYKLPKPLSHFLII